MSRLETTFKPQFSEEQIIKVRELYKKGLSILSISKETGMSKTHVWRVCSDITRERAKQNRPETGIRNEYDLNDDDTVTIHVTHKGRKLEAIVSMSDFERIRLISTKWYGHYSKNNDSFYVMYKNQHSPHIQLHRFIMNPPEDMLVDHINHDTLDNRRENLRIVTHSQNQQNRKKQGGVTWYEDYNKWCARFVLNRKKYFVGYFDDKEEAERAVEEKKKSLL